MFDTWLHDLAFLYQRVIGFQLVLLMLYIHYSYKFLMFIFPSRVQLKMDKTK